ncbi:diguanylate cyclase [Pseudomonas sp. 5P_3.1_Bac2]|uniref:GGDEF domain-containing protein n=1 Tax=Pseudomonas sp. 5P_3.1_Bac2 TaxID=2971617 RepID=UPI003965B558
MKPIVRRSRQQYLLLKKFGMALTSYCLLGAVTSLAIQLKLLAPPSAEYRWVLALIVVSQGVFAGLFLSSANLRFRDPSLLQPQMLVAIISLTVLLPFFAQLRGCLLVFYVPIMLFGVFKLSLKVLMGYALLAFAGYLMVMLHQALNHRLHDPALALLQLFALAALLFWLCLFASHTQKMRKRMHQRRYAMQAQQHTLRGMMRELEDLAATDELTGLYNRRHFLHIAKRELHGMTANQQHGLALLDLDLFKRINDVYGHAAGDQVLQTFANVALACLRDGDVVARYGGEEFVLLLPNADAEQLSKCCERLRLAFSCSQPLESQVVNLSVSIGMTLLGQDDDLEAALHRADLALYQAKREGRNRCIATWQDADA